MPDELYFKLRVIAASEDRSTSKQIVRILDEYVNKYESEHGTINIPDSE
jgi:plasmid stability protein